MKIADLEIVPLDYYDFGMALLKIAENRERQANILKLGTKRDNALARAIRLKRIAKQLIEGD